MKQFIECGRITNTHGLQGELRFEPWSDGPDFVAALPRVFVNKIEHKIERAKVHGRFVIVKFVGIDDVDSAVRLKGSTAYLDRGDITLPDGTYFLEDALGLPVFTEDGTELGSLVEVLDRPAHDVFVVRGTDGEHLIPNIPEFVLETDINGGKITVRLIDGM